MPWRSCWRQFLRSPEVAEVKAHGLLVFSLPVLLDSGYVQLGKRWTAVKGEQRTTVRVKSRGDIILRVVPSSFTVCATGLGQTLPWFPWLLMHSGDSAESWAGLSFGALSLSWAFSVLHSCAGGTGPPKPGTSLRYPGTSPYVCGCTLSQACIYLACTPVCICMDLRALTCLMPLHTECAHKHAHIQLD